MRRGLFAAWAVLMFLSVYQNCGVDGSGTSIGEINNSSHASTGDTTGTDGGTNSGGTTTGSGGTTTTGTEPLSSDDFISVTESGMDRNNAHVECPSNYKVSGCVSKCGDAYGAGGSYPDISANGCRGSCDSAGDTVTMTAMCAKIKSGRTINIPYQSSAADGAEISCPAGQKLLGCAANCQNGRSGGSSVINAHTGCHLKCSTTEVGGIIAAFCLDEPGRIMDYPEAVVAGGGSLTCPSDTYLSGGGSYCGSAPAPGGLVVDGKILRPYCPTGDNATVFAGCIK